jgi:hypothetical protein
MTVVGDIAHGSLVFVIVSGGKWNDVNCGITRKAYACKKRKPGTPTEETPSTIIKGGCPQQYTPSPYS